MPHVHCGSIRDIHISKGKPIGLTSALNLFFLELVSAACFNFAEIKESGNAKENFTSRKSRSLSRKALVLWPLTAVNAGVNYQTRVWVFMTS